MIKIKMKIVLSIFMLIHAFTLIGCSDNDRAWKDTWKLNTVDAYVLPTVPSTVIAHQ